MGEKKPSREAVAWKEIGSTAISYRLAVGLSVFFLLTVFLVPLSQYAFDLQRGTGLSFALESGKAGAASESAFAMVERRNKAALMGIHQLETSLEEGSLLRRTFLPPLQYVLLRFFGKGNEKVTPGKGGWLHFAPALDALVGPPFLNPEQLRARETSHKLWEVPIHPDPLAAIIDFNKQLAARGITLIVMPIPVKAAIQPDTLSARRVVRPLANRSWQPFLKALQENGVQFFDARPVLTRYSEEHGDAYLRTDTHWLPGAMQAVAEQLGTAISQQFPSLPKGEGLHGQPQTVVGDGDIGRMLTLPEKAGLYPGQEVQIRQILNDQQEFWQPDRNGAILLLGDSFINIYSTAGLGWGAGAGFAEQLSHYLQTPLDLLARNDSGAYVTREMLAGELARGRDRLAGKKLVIWQFAERELAAGDWRPVALHLGAPKDSGFYLAPAGEKIRVTGVVRAISRSAQPGSVPYRDNILTLHLVDLQGVDRELLADQALVYGFGMRDNQLTRLAALRAGDSVSLILSPWDAVEGELGSNRRTPLDDQRVELESPNWGKITDEKMD